MKPPSRRHCSVAFLNLIAFLATLAAIVALTLAGAKDTAILTGLVGVLGSFRPWTQFDQGSDKTAAQAGIEEPNASKGSDAKMGHTQIVS